MAQWESVERYIYANYKVAGHEGTWMRLQFDAESGRSQLLMIARAGALIQFLCPFATRDEVAMDRVFAAMREEGIVLGITSAEGFILVTHSQLLATVDEEEIDAGIQLAVGAADLLATNLGT